MRCALCGGSVTRWQRIDGWDVDECQACGHRQAALIQQTDAHRHADDVYGDAYFTEGGAGYTDYHAEAELLRRRGARYGRILARHAAPGRLLDVGAAAGYLLDGLTSVGWSGIGLEPNDAMAAHARQRGVDVRTGLADEATLSALSIAEGSLDAVTMIQVIAHVLQPVEALEALTRRLRPGGLLLVETWDRGSLTAGRSGPDGTSGPRRRSCTGSAGPSSTPPRPASGCAPSTTAEWPSGSPRGTPRRCSPRGGPAARWRASPGPSPSGWCSRTPPRISSGASTSARLDRSGGARLRASHARVAGCAARVGTLLDMARNSTHLGGLLALGAGLGAGELAAAAGSWRSPILAVADAIVDRSPEAVVRRAIDLFGTADKLVLIAGTVVVLVLAAPAVLSMAVRGRRVAALVITGAVVALGAVLATAGRQGSAADAIPVLVAGAVFAAFLLSAGRDRTAKEPEPTEQGVTAPRPPITVLGRRQIIAAGAVAVGGGLGGRLLASARTNVDRSLVVLPKPGMPAATNSVAAPTGAPMAGVSSFITPNAEFYRIDTALLVPQVDHRTWKLRIDGAVDRPLTLTYDDLLKRPQVEHVATLLCVSNPIGGELIGTARWQGVLLKDLLEEVGVQPAGTQVFSTSVDGWTCGFPTEIATDGRMAMIALGMNGEPLPVRHGFPARLIVPGLYGYVSSTKWLSRIELNDWATNDGYWMPRGWSKEGPVKPGSRIDTPRRSDALRAGRIGVGGVAWANHRGVSEVQVRVDEGEWQDATVHDGVNDDSWRQWTWMWDAPRGGHQLEVRMRTKDGEWQTGDWADVAPDGATGWHSVFVNVA